MGVMRSRARPGAYRSVRALAWWNLALSRTTAIFFPSSVSRARRSIMRVICSAFWFPWIG